MPNSRWILSLLCVAMTASLVACGGSTKNPQNEPAPATASSVSIAFQPSPPAAVSQLSTAKITAVVSNDPGSAGVDWALVCNAASCGSLAPLHTASGAAATYTPPSTPSGNTQSVTIEAFAAADHSKNVVANLNVTGFAGNLKGTYVFETKGQDQNGNNSSGGIYQLVGVIALDGNGNITAGEQTRNGPVVSASNPNGPIISVSDAITGGSYTVGPDGRGTLTLNTADPNIGQQGIENFSLVVLSSSQALISTLDNQSGTPALSPSGETSMGTLDLQTSTTAPTGGYAFAVNGIDANYLSMAMGGVLNIDSPNQISGSGSVADQVDSGTLTPNAAVSGTLTGLDSLGSLKFNLAAGFAPSLQFTGYIVDSNHIKLIESDNGSGTGFGLTAGVAIGQGAARGTFTSNSSFAGNYVFDILGQDPISQNVSNTFASVGQFTADSSGNLSSGYDDEYLASSVIGISDSFTGTYTLDPSGTGRVDSTVTFTSSGAGPELIFYLTGNGNPPLVLDADDNPSSSMLGTIGVGAATPQTAPPYSFNGRYGIEYVENSNNLVPNYATGQMIVSGSTGTLSGTVDTNSNFNPAGSSMLTGTTGAIPNSGRSTGTLTNSFFPPGNANVIAVAYYFVDSSHGYFVETDFATLQELSFGYFATRTPVCSGCP